MDCSCTIYDVSIDDNIFPGTNIDNIDSDPSNTSEQINTNVSEEEELSISTDRHRSIQNNYRYTDNIGIETYKRSWRSTGQLNNKTQKDILAKRLGRSMKLENNISELRLSMTNESALYLRKRRVVLDTPFSIRSTVSYGFIVYANDTKRWAIIQRKHSVEFLLFIRGLYRLTYLPLILSCITDQESKVIYKCLEEGPETFKNIYLNDLGLPYDGLDYALIRMAESRNVVTNLLPKLSLITNKLSWTWPKGRLHISSNSDIEQNHLTVNSSNNIKGSVFHRETPFDCARREFTEEVEIILPPPLFISDTYISENIKTLTGRIIESRYWIYIISNEISMTPPQSHPEVSDRLWATTDQCRELVRHDTLFQQVINMVSNINIDPN